jgi:hypothetical protein
MKNSNKLLDPRNLPYFGAVVQAVLFAIAGSQFFPNPYFGGIAGLGVGAVVNYSIALASTRISDIAEKRKPLARLALIFMFCLSPTTITLSLFFPTVIYTAISWAMCVDLSIILAGAIAGKSMLPDSKPKASKMQGEGKGSKKKATLPQVARKPLTNDILLAYLAENKGQTQQQVAEYFGVKRQAIGARMKTIYGVKKEEVKQ